MRDRNTSPARRPACWLLLAMMALPPVSLADLTGQQVDLSYNFGDQSGILSATVGFGPEFVLVATGNPAFSTATIDIVDSTITITHNRGTTLGPGLPVVSDDVLTFSFPGLTPQLINDVQLTNDAMPTWFAGLAFDGSSITLTQLQNTAGVNTSLKEWTVSIGVPPTEPSFRGLGEIPGGLDFSTAAGVSADGGNGGGPVVIGSSEGASGLLAFLWDGNLLGIGDLAGGAFQSRGYDISADGSTAVGRGTSGAGTEAFRRTQAGGMTGLGDLPGGPFNSIAWGVSGDGTVVVGQGTVAGNNLEAFRWTPGGGMDGLGTLPGSQSSFAFDVDATGSIVVGGTAGGGGLPRQAFRWTADGGMVGLGDLPGANTNSVANAISGDGQRPTGSASNVQFEAWRWTAQSGLVSLGDLPGGATNAVALGVSDDGALVVGFGTTEAGTEAFILDQLNGMRRLQGVLEDQLGLDLTGWTLTEASAIDDDGLGSNESVAIVGSGVNPDGDTEAWLARIPVPTAPVDPEPEQVPLLPLALQLLLAAIAVLAVPRVFRRHGAA